MSQDQALSTPIIRSLVIRSAKMGRMKITFSGSERGFDCFDFPSHEEISGVTTSLSRSLLIRTYRLRTMGMISLATFVAPYP
jgi:hypothetical protein